MIFFYRIVVVSALFFSCLNLYAQRDSIDTPANITNDYSAGDFEIEFPRVILSGITKEIKIKVADPAVLKPGSDVVVFYINGQKEQVTFVNGEASISYTFSEKKSFFIEAGNYTYTEEVNPIPLWLSILPPLIAILMALLFREVISALFLGIFVGAATIHIYSYGPAGFFSGLLSVIDTYIIGSLENWDHLAVILFSMTIGAMVTVISKNGGMQGVVDKISRYAQTAKSGQAVTWFLGIAIFFDDYANTLVVGNTMRPVTDRLRISREKLSYIVDSTAAPVAAIAFVTTWIGAELGYIKDSISSIEGLDESAYNIFLNSLKYSFYPLFTLAFILMLVLRSRDYGPMHKAEMRARTTGLVSNSNKSDVEEKINEELAALEPKDGVKPKWFNAVIPVVIVIAGTIAGLLYTGWDAEIWNSKELGFFRKLSNIIGNANSYLALLWASLGGLVTAILLTLLQKIMNLSDTMESMMKGFKTMLGAVMILVLAWSLAMITEHLHTADFITQGLLSFDLSPVLIPAITFILAGLVAFSTGSSWGTMAILYPLMLPATWLLCEESGYDYDQTLMIFHNVVSCVLAGSVLGDHCSPISDTTILSSLATSCNHIDHVRTQLPYALSVAAVAVLCGTIPGALGISSMITMPLGIIILYFVISFFGKKVHEPVA